MYFSSLITLSAFAASLTVATPLERRQRDCPALYDQCIASGKLEVACSCDRTACYGEDAARIREWCASQTANGVYPTTLVTSSKAATSVSSAAASIITGTAGSQPSGQPPITAPAGSLALGATCSDDRQCANGAQCWASNAMLIRSCGNFNAACTKDSQCAFNTCNNGLCNGFKPTPSSTVAKPSSTVTIITGTAGSQPSGQPPITAPAGSLALGATCSDDRQCAGGAQCWASTAWLIRSCGNFNAACKSDAQCAFNTCNNGLCNGFKASSSSSSAAPAPTATTAAVQACGVQH